MNSTNKEYVYTFIHPFLGEIIIYTKTKNDNYVKYYSNKLEKQLYKYLRLSRNTAKRYKYVKKKKKD